MNRNYEMAHQNLSEELLSTELWSEREAAVTELRDTANALAAITDEFNIARDSGNIPQGLWEANTEVQVAHVKAMERLLKVNVAIRNEGL